MLKALRHAAQTDSAPKVIAFLGDNRYHRGMPDSHMGPGPTLPFSLGVIPVDGVGEGKEAFALMLD